MRCPVCGGDCVTEAHEILEQLPGIFSPCPGCRARILNKRLPLADLSFETPCTCGKRYIDEVFAQIYVIMIENEILSGTDPLKAVGMPLIHPGFVMQDPPYLPKQSLVLLSPRVTPETAGRIIREVPEVRGVVRSGDFVPGVLDTDLTRSPAVYELLSGCDVRADIFSSTQGSLVLYKQQSLIHIEFPRSSNPKIVAVEEAVHRSLPSWFVDACSGIGTLGLTAARMGIPHVVLNDAWYAASFWAGYNLWVNREFFQVDSVEMVKEYEAMKQHPVGHEPTQVAVASGEQEIIVYQGDFNELYRVLPKKPVLAVIDLFEKENRVAADRIKRNWMEHVAGEVFIP
jgi:hypothetical protein